MSILYDDYLREHKANVQKGYDWLKENLPYLVENVGSWNTEFNHDASKTESDEYTAYDQYFYGNNKSYEVVQAFNKAWLLHIHRNPHHWQYWVLINDDPKAGKITIEMPYEYIIEMICDWWSFSWKTGNLFEIFNWYGERKDYIKLGSETRKIVEDILTKIHYKLVNSEILMHHGVKGQKWGVKNGPPYPINRSGNTGLKNANGQSIIKVEKTELTGEPNTITQVTNAKGGIDRNYYDESGRQSKQISNNDHGRPKGHDYGEHGEHAHDYIYDDSNKLIGRPTRELNDTERKENGDIL